ncbi:hypothetical protein ACFE6N_04585 [Pedobacter sp. BG31]|uniref:hypothetical protein n=1 Tax=Pedobacter sp. BG31 TaxID=3349697 RepID=UPI0035F2DA61
MAILLILLGAILLIIGMSFALKSIKPVYFNVISGAIIIIGTIFGLFGKQLQDLNSSEKSDKILFTSTNTEENVKELKNTLEKQAQTIDELRRENTDLYSKLSSATKENAKQILGDGQPSLSANFHPDKLISLIISNQNDYPIYDIRLTFPDPDQTKIVAKMAETEKMPSWDDMRKQWITVSPFNLAPKSSISFYNFYMPESLKTVGCFVNIVTRHGTFSGRITVIRQGETFQYDVEVRKAKPF